MDVNNNIAEHYKILSKVLELGEAMLQSGIEINRVEFCLAYMGRSFGASRTDIIINNIGLMGTMVFPDGISATQTRRVRGGTSINCIRAERLEALVTSCSETPVSIDEFSKRFEECLIQKPTPVLGIIGGLLSIMSFTLLFGGTAADMLAAGFSGIFVVFAKAKLQRFTPNTLIFNIVGSLIAGLVACIVCGCIPGLHLGKIITGAMLPMIPGLAFVHALRDVFMGETQMGTTRFVESLLWATGLALGFVSAMIITGVIPETAVNPQKDLIRIIVMLVAAYTASLGFAMSFKLPRRLLFLAPLVGTIACGVKLLTTPYFGDAYIPNFLAGLTVAALAAFLSRKCKTTPMVFAVPGILPCLPGSLMFATMNYAVCGEVELFLVSAAQMTGVAVAASAGLCFVWAIEAIVVKVYLEREKQAALQG